MPGADEGRELPRRDRQVRGRDRDGGSRARAARSRRPAPLAASLRSPSTVGQEDAVPAQLRPRARAGSPHRRCPRGACRAGHALVCVYGHRLVALAFDGPRDRMAADGGPSQISSTTPSSSVARSTSAIEVTPRSTLRAPSARACPCPDGLLLDGLRIDVLRDEGADVVVDEHQLEDRRSGRGSRCGCRRAARGR